jgi:hypothetical protein
MNGQSMTESRIHGETITSLRFADSSAFFRNGGCS